MNEQAQQIYYNHPLRTLYEQFVERRITILIRKMLDAKRTESEKQMNCGKKTKEMNNM